MLKNIKVLHLSFVSFFALLLIYSSSIAANFVEEAQEHLKKGEVRAAVIQLKNQLKENPDDAHARNLLGNIYLKQADFASAEKELGRAALKQPDNVDYKLDYSQVLLLNKNYKQSLKELDFKAQGKQENLRQVYLGYANLGLNQVDQAKKEFNVGISNNVPEASIGMAKIAIREKNYSQAESLLAKALKQLPDNIEAQILQAKTFNLQKKYPQALASYNQLITKYPNLLPRYLERAATHIALKKYTEAEQDITTVLKENKKHPFAHFLLAQIKLQQKDFSAAKDAAQVVINANSHHHPSKLIMGISNYALGNLNQSDKNLTEYLSVNPDNIPVQNILANVYLAQQKPHQAVLLLDGIEQEKIDNNPQLATTLGSAYLLMGEHQKGVELLNKVKALDPNNLIVQKRLIAGQLQGGDKISAIEGMENVAKQEPDNNKVHYLLIISYIQEKMLDKAEAKLKDMLGKTPNDPLLYNFTAALELVKGNKDKAKQAYQQALKVDQKYIPAYMGLAKFAYSEGDEKTAIKNFTKVTEIQPQYLAAYFALASMAEKNKQLTQAETHLINAYQNNKGQLSNQLKVLSLLSKWYAKQKSPEKLLGYAKEMEKQYPEQVAALSFAGGVYSVNSDVIQAKRLFRDIIRRQPKDTKHRVLLANLLAKEGNKTDEVLSILQDVYNADPTKATGLTFKVNYLIKQKQYEQANSIAKKIEDLFPKQAIGLKLQGDVLWVQEQKDAAINKYRAAYQKQPGVKSLFALTDLMLKDKKSDIAIQFLNEELKQRPDSAAILIKLASTHEQLGNKQKAISYYQKVLAKKDDNVLALNNLAWIYYQQKDIKALALAEKAYQKAPKSYQIADTYGVILMQQKNYPKALEILKAAAEKAPSDYAVQYHLAQAYQANNNKQQAIDVLSVITSSDKDFNEKEAAQELLNKLIN
ncbi:MAG: PEP-CTERM system TPR-repeat protein PrsT [Gammaproteobacteria bacterium]|nr:PEP-CTERM system TPR-repeat protein PrsT [Gammaproteobacteria bacterium]